VLTVHTASTLSVAAPALRQRRGGFPGGVGGDNLSRMLALPTPLTSLTPLDRALTLINSDQLR
jgi:hypothetical protein